ncbi:phage tail protein [Achromobacter deleyi]|uniref:Phage tail protein n=1 Tax=Achromobacter deleyi TaxID=1353891 RepID=A0A7T4AZB1_9BURK|nr:phage tail protein [Achromobacter deleyi]QQB32834.1 phage tail protein [Achromobacter deleyi]
MEQLEQINVGQQANDGTGDPLRDGMQRVNANFTKVEAGVDVVEQGVAAATATANDAKTKADAAVPAVEKGMAGGVAPLDASGKVPTAHLPVQADYIPVEEKGAAGGVAPLDSSGKVPAVNLPAAQDSIPLTQKGVAGGVATLDDSGQVPVAQLGGAVKSTEKGAATGVATLDAGGKVPTSQLPPIPSGPPVASIAWWPLRTSIPAGQIPADGQTVSRATFPDLAAMVTGGKVPVVTEADWQADPLKRGAYTLGDGSTTLRMPDFNGQSSGSLGALFQRGDGALSSGTNGLIQRDALQNITGLTRNLLGLPSQLDPGSGALQKQDIGTSGSGGTAVTLQFVNVGFDASRSARTGTETRPTSVSGVWTIQAFGAVTNPGSADAAQLASDYAALNSRVQTLDGKIDFVILYPNGGSEAAPASVAANATYVVQLPASMLGSFVMCRAELLYSDGWAETGWYTDSSGGNRAAGTRAGQISGGAIIVRTGVTDVWPTPNLGGTPTQGALVTPNKCRVLVWRIKGKWN